MLPLHSAWWLFLIRGICAIVFGVLTFVMPQIAMLTMVILFGAFALVEGALSLAAALRKPAGDEPRISRPALVLQGMIGIVAGALTFLLPGLTALALAYIIAAWATFSGIMAIVAAIQLRKQITGEWMLVLSGVVSVTFGVLVALFPGAGVIAIALWVGVYTFVFGILLVALSLKLRKLARQTHPPQRTEAHGDQGAAAQGPA